MNSGEFAVDLRRRVREARQALAEARAEDDLYAADVRLGELDSMLRLAMEHGVEVGDVSVDR
ncbi:hypothetical protein E1263_07265 [Kribbella antibiotica]|uniref:Uncharacterized protein n=1 Tax=Kribbella antibiotica TaxID=190195 RepID=A0A4R4ZWE7_9ACTN|nr:hypothetical protein [Kribbella antibiotica]TDD61492.1 hypothetical protein E1263_07265 [Kribbella antibiotica]